jgi:hypothetical protein
MHVDNNHWKTYFLKGTVKLLSTPKPQASVLGLSPVELQRVTDGSLKCSVTW